jgi:hypothetical protein
MMHGRKSTKLFYFIVTGITSIIDEIFSASSSYVQKKIYNLKVWNGECWNVQQDYICNLVQATQLQNLDYM